MKESVKRVGGEFVKKVAECAAMKRHAELGGVSRSSWCVFGSGR